LGGVAPWGEGGLVILSTHIIVALARKGKTTRTREYLCRVTSNHGVQLLHALEH